MKLENLIGLKQASDLSGFSKQGLWARIKSGKLVGIQIAGQWLVDRATIEALSKVAKHKGGRPGKIKPEISEENP